MAQPSSILGRASPHSVKSKLLIMIMIVILCSYRSSIKSCKSASCGDLSGFKPKSSMMSSGTLTKVWKRCYEPLVVNDIYELSHIYEIGNQNLKLKEFLTIIPL